jgi:hypothetical protein
LICTRYVRSAIMRFSGMRVSDMLLFSVYRAHPNLPGGKGVKKIHPFQSQQPAAFPKVSTN